MREELRERGLRQKDFAQQISVQPTHLNAFIKGKRNLNEDLAMKLEKHLGIPFKFWMNLQSSYIYDCKAIEQLSTEERESFASEKVKDEFIGKAATSGGEGYEAELKADLIGEAIKKAREDKHLTQAQLGEMAGVKRSQISKIESGKNVTFATMARLFKAMGIDAKLDLGAFGKIALW